jgi:uncharacterized lipoprotein YddW (UPF0748 family)
MEENNTKKKKDYKARRKTWVSVSALVIAVIFLFWTIAASLMSVWASDTNDDEMRGVWVSTIYNLDYPSKSTTDAAVLKAEADKILDNVKAMNMNTVFLQVRPGSDALYDSDIFPWSKYLTGTQGVAPADGFDPLEYWVTEAHKRGLELHAWINPYRITKEGDTEWNTLTADNPAKGAYADCVVKYSDGNYYYDPGNPQSIDLIVKGALEIVKKYDVDGIHMDDYFYPGTDFADDASWAAYGAGYSSREDWRRDNVNKLVAELDKQLHNEDKDLRFGISPQGIWANSSTMSNGSATKGNEAYTQKFADCLAWIKAGTIDYIAPQIYWNIGYSIADYKVLADWWSNAVSGSDVDLYIGMADYKTVGVTNTNNVWYGTAELKRQLDLNRSDKNIKGEIHFRYKSIADNQSLVNLYKSYYAPSDTGIKISVDGNYVKYTDAVPFIDSNQRTLCPLRVVADALGMNVEWDGEGRRATFSDDDTTVVFTIDSDKYEVNGNVLTMDTAAVIKNSRTYAPVRYLAEAAGYSVDWDSTAKTVVIKERVM